jgi:hypothetical protein
MEVTSMMPTTLTGDFTGPLRWSERKVRITTWAHFDMALVVQWMVLRSIVV